MWAGYFFLALLSNGKYDDDDDATQNTFSHTALAVTMGFKIFMNFPLDLIKTKAVDSSLFEKNRLATSVV
jgi:hypothetical protein